MNTKTAWLTLVVGLIPMLTGTGLTQDAVKAGFPPHQGAHTPPLAERAISISGRANNDGNALVDRNGGIWTVANPEVLKDYAGRQVSVKGHGNAGAKTIRVLSIRQNREQVSYSAKWDDSAFRR